MSITSSGVVELNKCGTSLVIAGINSRPAFEQVHFCVKSMWILGTY